MFRRLSTPPPLKIPLSEICIGLLCYSRLSGTLAQTYLSMSVRKTKKQKTKQKAENNQLLVSFHSLVFFLPLFSRITSPLLCINLRPFHPSPRSDATQSSKPPFSPSLASSCVLVRGAVEYPTLWLVVQYLPFLCSFRHIIQFCFGHLVCRCQLAIKGGHLNQIVALLHIPNCTVPGVGYLSGSPRNIGLDASYVHM